MSTRGFVGFKLKGAIKGWYNHFDSYPEGLGEVVLRNLSTMSKKARKKFFTEVLTFLEPTGNQGGGDEIYENHKKLNSNFWKDIESLKILDGKDFYKDGLYCEYAYIYNLDNHTLECYKGWGKSPSKGLENWFHSYPEKYYVNLAGVINFRNSLKIDSYIKKLREIYKVENEEDD